MLSPFSTKKIKIKNLQVYYDKNTSTKVRETPNLLQYESQHFRCRALLEFSESIAEQDWSVGLVQACDFMYLENRYGEHGSTFWEFHPLRSKRHTMVNDSDGRQYPFYSLTSSKCEVAKGMVENGLISLQYEDHFYPTVAWTLPYAGGVHLTNIIRKQDFWVWLLAIKRGGNSKSIYNVYDPTQDRIHVLKTMRWRYNLQMTFDPSKPVGSRLTELMDIQQEEPYILNEIRPVPLCAMVPPHCNAAQSLLWYPSKNSGRVKALVTPKQVIVPWEAWCTDMVPSGGLSIMKPKDCQMVRTWARDKNVKHISRSSSATVAQRQLTHSRAHHS